MSMEHASSAYRVRGRIRRTRRVATALMAAAIALATVLALPAAAAP